MKTEDTHDPDLIAAAPELLAALELVVGAHSPSRLDSYGHQMPQTQIEAERMQLAIATARSAIAKAKGLQ